MFRGTAAFTNKVMAGWRRLMLGGGFGTERGRVAMNGVQLHVSADSRAGWQDENGFGEPHGEEPRRDAGDAARCERDGSRCVRLRAAPSLRTRAVGGEAC